MLVARAASEPYGDAPGAMLHAANNHRPGLARGYIGEVDPDQIRDLHAQLGRPWVEGPGDVVREGVVLGLLSPGVK